MLLSTGICEWGTGWGNIYCAHWCVSDVIVREMLLCTVMCVWGGGWGKCKCVRGSVYEVQDQENFKVYIDVYDLQGEEMLLCRLMFARGTGWGNITEYSDFCLIYRIREMLHCSVVCVWGREWRKCYCVEWCVSELQCERNFTAYNEVYITYRVREMLLCTVMCVWSPWEGNVTV